MFCNYLSGGPLQNTTSFAVLTLYISLSIIDLIQMYRILSHVPNILQKCNSKNNYFVLFLLYYLIHFYIGQTHMLEKYVTKLYEKRKYET